MSFKLGLALGIAAGVVVGLATAPRPGRETRERLAHRGPDESPFTGNGQGASPADIPTTYQAAADGDPPTLYPGQSEADG